MILGVRLLFSKRKIVARLFVENKTEFTTKVGQHFSALSKGKIPKQLLLQIIEVVSDKLYKQYLYFWWMYPKSRKHYSKLKAEDIKHPFTCYEITLILEKECPEKISTYSKILFEMNDKELEVYNQSNHDFMNK